MKISLLRAGFVCLLLAGCMNAKHLVYVHTATVGLEVAASTDAAPGRMVFGYDRDTFALVPRKKDNEDAMSLAAVSCIYANGLTNVKFRHFVTSGEAAKTIVETPEILSEIKDSVRGIRNDCVQD